MTPEEILERLVDRLRRYVDDDGRVVTSTAVEWGDWRPGVVVDLSPPTVLLPREGQVRVRARNTNLTSVAAGDVVMCQRVGPFWVAVYEIEVI